MRRDDGEPLRLLVLGDFSGKPAAGRTPLAARATQQIDVDTLDAVMQRTKPRLTSAAGEIAFDRIDDFHPDRLYAGLAAFETLRQARSRKPDQAETDALLGRLLGQPAAPPRPVDSPAPATGLDALIRNIVAPHVVPDTSAAAAAHLAAVDAAIAEEMRAVLHDPAFQALEANWRGVQWLVSGLELDEMLQLHLFDVTRDELLADAASAGGAISSTGLYRALIDRWRNVPGAQGWSVLTALFDFTPTAEDAGLLAALGAIASQAGAPLLAGFGAASTAGAENVSPEWQALRRSGAAKWIGLAAPRVLLRRPYGRRSDPIDAFAFEEIPGTPEHEHFLWGTASLATTLLLGRSFMARGWDLEPGDEREIGDMPAFTFDRDGEMELQACAERYLTESDIRGLLNAGIIPIASRRDTNGVVAIRFQSIADPPAALAW
jgi:type VI secretion system ImpC/EvpB family protein